MYLSRVQQNAIACRPFGPKNYFLLFPELPAFPNRKSGKQKEKRVEEREEGSPPRGTKIFSLSLFKTHFKPLWEKIRQNCVETIEAATFAFSSM